MTIPHGGATEIWRDTKGAAGVGEQPTRPDGSPAQETDPYNPPKDKVRDWGREVERKMGMVFYDRDFGVQADGVTDDASVYQQIAADLPDGATLVVQGAGDRIIGSKVLFAQGGLTIRLDKGARFKQASGTSSMDTMIECSGDFLTWEGGKVHGNIFGNGVVSLSPYSQTAPYEGRGELLKITGDYATCNGLTVEETQLNSGDGVPCGLYIGGSHSVVRNFTSFDTGRCAIRDAGDHTVINGARGFRIYSDNADQNGSRFIGKDLGPLPGGANDAPFNRVTYSKLYVQSDSTNWVFGFVVDVNERQGGEVIVEDAFFDFPNATGPDCFKVGYVDRLVASRVKTEHAGNGADNACLRLQQGLKELVLTDVDLAGFVNFDDAAACDMTVSGKSRFGRTRIADYGIQQFPGGSICIADGSTIKGFGKAAILLATTELAYQSMVMIGALHLAGTDAASAIVIASTRPSGSHLRRRARQFVVQDPVSISGMRTRGANGSWITASVGDDAAALQGPASEHLVNHSATSDYNYITSDGPGDSRNNNSDVDGFDLGDMLRARNAKLGEPGARVCTTAGSSNRRPYGTSALVTVGDRMHHAGNVYVCTTEISNTTTAPTGTGANIVDDTGAWAFVAPKAEFSLVSNLS